MKSKRIITTVLTLCFVALALAGIASARDIGTWTELISPNSTFLGSTTRTKQSNAQDNKAVCNVRNSGSDPGYIYDTGIQVQSVGDETRALGDYAGMYWRVKMRYSDGSGYFYATPQTDIFHNARQLVSYNSNYNNYTNRKCKLWLKNYNSFVISTHGTWCPDSM